jgi:hypothetical protein
MFLGLSDPDPSVRDMATDPVLPFSQRGTEIILAKSNFNTKF